MKFIQFLIEPYEVKNVYVICVRTDNRNFSHGIKLLDHSQNGSIKSIHSLKVKTYNSPYKNKTQKQNQQSKIYSPAAHSRTMLHSCRSFSL